MPESIFEGSHAEFAATESHVPSLESAWLKWVADVETILGHSIDGDQESDGYSLDYAGDDWRAGFTPQAYADAVKARQKAMEPSRYVVAVYLAEMSYGGPEEGGWWYECGRLVRLMRSFKSEARARVFCSRLNIRLDATLNKGRRPMSSVLSTGRYVAHMDGDTAPKTYPERRPRYE